MIVCIVLRMVFPIPNDLLLAAILVALVLCMMWEYTVGQKMEVKPKKKKNSLKGKVYLSSPIHQGCVSRTICYPDIMSLASWMPRNVYIRPTKSTLLTDNDSIKPESAAMSNKSIAAASSSKKKDGSDVIGSAVVVSDLAAKIIFPYMPGCEPNSSNAEELNAKFPSLSRTDVIRFLVARKGNLKAAEEMVEKYLAWHSSYFPLKKKEVEVAFKTECFVPYGQARDGSPVVYMRGGLYDNTIATPEQYVLAAAHTIEYSLAQYPDQVNVTVIAHTANVPGHPPATADMDFIKLFIAVLSDNFPERLKRLAIFPFPWYGRALWSIAKVFLDKRTQDKVLLLSHSGEGIPEELKKYMDVNEMPAFVGGKCKRPTVDLFATLDAANNHNNNSNNNNNSSNGNSESVSVKD